MEGNWQATEVGLQMNLGRETATRAAKRLIMLPPFTPAAETWARTTVESNICTKFTLFQCPNFSGRARQVIL
jgi:hypothetical protein